MNSCTTVDFKIDNIVLLCILVRGGTSKKGHKKGHKWPFSVCVNLKKDPNRRTNMHSTIIPQKC